MSLSNAYEDSLMDHITGRTTLTFDTSIFLSLHTADPGETGASEWTDSGYARQAVDFDAATTSGAKNTNIETFPAVVDGTISAVWFGLYTAVTSGTFTIEFPSAAASTAIIQLA